MAAVPFFVQPPPDAARYCHPDPHQPSAQPPRRSAKSEPAAAVDDDLPPLLELRDAGPAAAAAAAARRTLNHHAGMLERGDPTQLVPAAVYPARTPGYLPGDPYYRPAAGVAAAAAASDFAPSYPYASSLVARPFGNGYCRSAYPAADDDDCGSRRYPPPESYFHPGVQPPAWARLPAVGGGAFPFPVAAEFGTANGRRGSYPAGSTADCCRTDIVAAADSAVSRHRRSPPPSNSCCRLQDSTGGSTERDHIVPTAGDDGGTVALSSKPSTVAAPSTGTCTTPVVVYPWMRKLHSRSNSGTGE